MDNHHPAGHAGALAEIYGPTDQWNDDQWEVWAMRILLDGQPDDRPRLAEYMLRGYAKGIIGAAPDVIERALTTVNRAHEWTGL